MRTEAEAYDDYGPKDIPIQDGETYTTRIIFPGARLLTHECVQGPICFRAAAYIATEGEVEQCEHWSCLDTIHHQCELCFIETMEEMESGSGEEPAWWGEYHAWTIQIKRNWIEAGNALDGHERYL